MFKIFLDNFPKICYNIYENKEREIRTIKEMICPFCGSIIYDDCDLDTDCIDFEIHRTKVILHMIGMCTTCEKEYQWDKIYKFDKYDNLREG